MSSYTRRRFIAAGIGTAGLGALAGCLSDGGGGSTADTSAEASFFVFGDWASQIAGDTAAAKTLVPIGQHGHGWEPGPQIRTEAQKADLFIRGMEGFQPWADDMVSSFQSDGADVTVVSAGSSVSLADSTHGDKHEGEGEDEHGHDGSLDGHAISHACGHMEGDEPEPLAAASAQGNASTFSQTHQPYAVELAEEPGYVTFEPENRETEKYAFFTDTHETVRPVETSVVHEAHSVESCDAIEEYYIVENDASEVTIELSGDPGTVVTLLAEGVSDDHNHGEEEEQDHKEGEHDHDGESEHDHEGEHDEEGEYDQEEESGHDEEGSHGHEEGHEEDGHGHGHDHGGKDPHFWMDPTLAKSAVGTIEDGFVSVDGENESAYADNADAYRSRLEELDEQFQSTLANASKDVVFVAGHNAYQYLGNRYDFEIQTLTGLSPDDQPTPRDIERAQQIIEEHDLEYVCADPLESQRAANQLVEETDATEVLPLTAIPGQTQEWADNDWGYVDVMEKVNLETLTKALNAE